MKDQATCQHENWQSRLHHCADCGITAEQLYARDAAKEARSWRYGTVDIATGEFEES